jgi:hypothetical protein
MSMPLNLSTVSFQANIKDETGPDLRPFSLLPDVYDLFLVQALPAGLIEGERWWDKGVCFWLGKLP